MGPALRDQAAARGVLVGSAVDDTALTGEPDYRACLAEQFNAVVPENVLKMDAVHPEPDRYDTAAVDRLVEFAAAHGQAVRGHTLVWDRRIPDWVMAQATTRERAVAILREHIAGVVGRYRGRVPQWDVVNEALTESGTLRAGPWRNLIGPDYVALAFRFARAADPRARLYYNDYATDLGKATAIADFVAGLRSDGVPVDGIGLQLHLDRDTDPALPAALLERLAGTGLDLAVTELDVALPASPTPADLQVQADLVTRVAAACLALDRCRTLMVWGFTDRHSWVSEFDPARGAATLLDADLRAKPAWHALAAALA